MSSGKTLFDELKRVQGLARWAGDTPAVTALGDCLTVLVAGREVLRHAGLYSLRAFWAALSGGHFRSWLHDAEGAHEYQRLRESTYLRYRQAREIARESRRGPARDKDDDEPEFTLPPILMNSAQLDSGWRQRSDWLPQLETVFGPAATDGRSTTDVYAAAFFLGSAYPQEFAVDQIASFTTSLLEGSQSQERWQGMTWLADLALTEGGRWLYSAGPVARLRGYSLFGGFRVANVSQSPGAEIQALDDGARLDLVINTDTKQTHLTAFPTAGIARGTSVPRTLGATPESLAASEDRLLTVLRAMFRPPG